MGQEYNNRPSKGGQSARSAPWMEKKTSQKGTVSKENLLGEEENKTLQKGQVSKECPLDGEYNETFLRGPVNKESPWDGDENRPQERVQSARRAPRRL